LGTPGRRQTTPRPKNRAFQGKPPDSTVQSGGLPRCAGGAFFEKFPINENNLKDSAIPSVSIM
jgi:hypothetical protein